MVRSTFGDDIHDLVAAPDASGVLKLAPGTSVQFYTAKTGGTPTTDYLVDSNDDGVFETVVTSVTVAANGYLPPFQGPDNTPILYFDPNPADADVKRVRYVSREMAGGTTGGTVTKVNTVSPDVNGNVTLSADNIGDGSAKVMMTPAERTAVASNTSGVSANASAIAGKADVSQLPNFTTLFQHPNHTGGIGATYDSTAGQVLLAVTSDTVATPDTVARRKADGNIEVGTAAALTDAVNLSLLNSRLTGVGGGGAVVRGLSLTASVAAPVNSLTTGAFTDLPTFVMTDAATGDRIRASLWLAYRAVAGTTGGIILRLKTAAAALTNRLPNPDFNTDITGWNSQSSLPLVRDTTTTQEGAGSLKATVGASVTVATSVAFWSDWQTLAAADTIFSAAIQARRSTATSRNVRVDVQYGDNTAVNTALNTGVLATAQGSTIAPTTTAFLRGMSDSAHRSGATSGAVPTGATKVRIKVTILSALAGDVFFFDAAQLEPMDPVPAYGNTGGGTSSALTVNGSFRGHPGTGTPQATPGTAGTATDEVTVITYPSSTVLGHAALGRGATTSAELRVNLEILVGGSGLTGQTIAFEFAQIAANPTATGIVAAHGTFVKVPAAA